MKKINLLLIIFFSCQLGFGQVTSNSIKYPVKDKQIIIDAQEASLIIEGYNGNNIVIEPAITTMQGQLPPEAAGLSLIASAIEKEDDIIHSEVLKNDVGVFSIRLLKSNCRHLHIMVPKDAYLKVSFANPWPDARVSFKNLSGVLEVEGSSQVMEFSYITGPLTLSANEARPRTGVSEKISISNLQIPKSKNTGAVIPFLNILTSYADVDISLPGDTKATVQAIVPCGDLFTDLDLVSQPISAPPPVKERYNGDLNGGGRVVAVHSTYGDVFIRKQ